MTQFTFYIDPGHGWLGVTDAQIEAAGLSRADFSEYSYRIPKEFEGGGLCFLEEDCDAPKFISRHPQRHTDFFRSLPELHIDTMADHSNMVRRCPRLGDLKISR